MVEYSICPKCNHKSLYFRESCGSWRCSHCKIEIKGDSKSSIENLEANE